MDEYYDYYAEPEYVSDYTYDDGLSEYAGPEFEPDSSWNDYISQGNDIGNYLNDFGQGMGVIDSDQYLFDGDLGSIINTGFDTSGMSPYTFSDIPLGAELTTGGNYGFDTAALSDNNPMVMAALQEGNQNLSRLNDATSEFADMGGGQVQLPTGEIVDRDQAERLMTEYGAPRAQSISPEFLRSGLYGALPVGSFEDDPRTRPSQSYLDENGDVVGLLGTEGTDYQNPYEYRTSNAGDTFIQDIRNNDAIGWLGEDGPQYYQDERIANNLAAGRPSLYGVQRPGSPGSGAAGATSGYRGQASASGGGANSQTPTTRAGVSGNSPTRNRDGTTTSNGAMGALNMAAMMAALMGGPKTGPKSTQGSKDAEKWKVARMKSTGKAKREGGLIQAHNYAAGGPVRGQFLSPSLVRHASGGQADAIPAQLAGGEFVVPSDVVSHLGDGNTDAGAAQLNQMMAGIRRHKGQPNRLPPQAKSPLAYMKGRNHG